MVNLCRIHVDAHRRSRTATGHYLADTADLRNALHKNCRGRVVERGRRQFVGGERQDHDRRIRRIHFTVCRVARQIGWKITARRVDRSLHVPGGSVDIPVQVELQSHVRLP
jgi:hypothetical protein